MTVDGEKTRKDSYYLTPARKGFRTDIFGRRLPSMIDVFNGVETIRYEDSNNQASMRLHNRTGGLAEMCEWLSSENVHRLPGGQRNILERERLVTYDVRHEDAFYRRVSDKETGFVFESSRGASLDQPGASPGSISRHRNTRAVLFCRARTLAGAIATGKSAGSACI